MILSELFEIVGSSKILTRDGALVDVLVLVDILALVDVLVLVDVLASAEMMI